MQGCLQKDPARSPVTLSLRTGAPWTWQKSHSAGFPQARECRNVADAVASGCRHTGTMVTSGSRVEKPVPMHRSCRASRWGKEQATVSGQGKLMGKCQRKNPRWPGQEPGEGRGLGWGGGQRWRGALSRHPLPWSATPQQGSAPPNSSGSRPSLHAPGVLQRLPAAKN